MGGAVKTSWMRGGATWALAVLIVAGLPCLAHASLFGQVSTAYTLEKGASDVGGFVSVFENSTMVFAQYRHGLFANVDCGVQGGIVDPEGGDVGLALGADAKFLVLPMGNDMPFDLALNPRISYINEDAFSFVSLGGSVVISRDYALAQGSIAPYGAFNMRFDNVHYDGRDLAPGVDNDDTDFNVSGIAGVKWDVSQLMDILGEVVFDENIGVTIGLNFKL